MRLFRHHDEVPAEFRGGVIALGNFDGVHRGHQAVIGAALNEAKRRNVRAAVMTFEPHPRLLFQPNLPPFRLSPLRIKARHIEALGVDFLYCQGFDRAFAAIPAEAFVQDILLKGLGVCHVVVGEDYVFGHKRTGSVALLRHMAAELGFGVTAVPPVRSAEGVVFSSTAVRQALAAGDMAAATAILGRPWEVEGRVEHGDARGRLLGFPTANVNLEAYARPATGAYAVRAGVDLGTETRWYSGVANFGRRPTFDKTGELLEVHLFDFAGDLYHQHLRVQFIQHLRPERAFDSLDALKAQIAADAQAARALLPANE